uniref:Amino acid transporter transmembrane domain-containing protein n=1 Tax=Eutreptiella gymnastica TaxID=73025 RepID=A0A7S1IXH2_9EUGL|mmetsp:Transcript_50652/g.90511  ORF Transcript_50652/g.90511 Transcript_50652/m.90511 type:complete len:507 (+) Transcript_50652:22-1542(+)
MVENRGHGNHSADLTTNPVEDDGIQRFPSTENADAFGNPNIGKVGSIALMINNVVGPGIVALPRIFQQAGWLVPLTSLSFAFFASSFACTMTAESMQLAPGNHRFDNRMEYCDIVSHYMGNKGIGSTQAWYYVSQFFYNSCLTCLNIGSIIVTAQTVDQVILFLFGSTYAYEVYPNVGFLVERSASMHTLPFAHDAHGVVDPYVLTLGYLVSCITIMPLGFLTLEENIIFQLVSCTVFIGIMFLFLGLFTTTADPARLHAVGNNLGQSVGVSLFCYSYAIAIPSWVNEKRKDVGINSTIWLSAFPSTILKILFGILGAMAFDHLSDNALQTVVQHQTKGAWANTVRLADFMFSIFVIGFGVPLFHIFVRYNLMNGGLCSRRTAAFWGIIFPWLVSWMLYNGDLYQKFLNYSSLVFNALTCFLLPMSVFAVAIWSGAAWYPEQLMNLNSSAAESDVEGEEEADDGLERVAMVRAVPAFLGHPLHFAIALLIVTTIVIIMSISFQIYE